MSCSKCREFCRSLWRTFSTLDFFTVAPSSRITFKGKLLYSTSIGKMMTLLIIFFSIIVFVYFGFNLFSRKSPKTIISEKYYNTPEYFNLTKDNFFISFSMRHFENGTMSSDESYFKPEFRVVKVTNKTNFEYIEVGLKSCDSGDIPSNPSLADYFRNNPITNMLCMSDYTPLELQGSLDSNKYTFMSLQLWKCNSTENSNCKSETEINDFFNNNEFYVQYTTFSVDPLNYEKGMDQHGNFYATPTNNLTKSLAFLTFEQMILTTDDGVVINEVSNSRGIAYVRDRIFFSPRKSDDNYLELRFNLDKVGKTYERTYDKLQEVLANTGGCIKIVMIFAIFIIKPIVAFYFYRDLANEYFDFEPGELTKKPMKIQMDIKIFEYYSSFFKKSDRKLQWKKRTWDKVKSLLDINLSLSQILLKIAELEKLKFLFLDKDQQVLFEYIPKPIISERCKMNPLESMKKSTYGMLSSGIRNFNDIYFKKYVDLDLLNAYEKVRSKVQKDKIDEIMLTLTAQDVNSSPVKKSGSLTLNHHDAIVEAETIALNSPNRRKIMSEKFIELKKIEDIPNECSGHEGGEKSKHEAPLNLSNILSKSDEESPNKIKTVPNDDYLIIDGKLIVLDLESLKRKEEKKEKE